MTGHDLHDALNELPSDLIAAADQVRTVQKMVIRPWRRILPVAACLVLLIGSGSYWMWRNDWLGHIDSISVHGIKQESAAAQAPAAAAPMAPLPMEEEVTADEAPAEDAFGTLEKETGLGVDHSHGFAEETENAGSTGASCGNMVTTVCIDGETYRVEGSDSVALTRILKSLPYTPEQVCRCMTEFTVDTEPLTGIQVNLTEAFARCEKGQAALTEEQTRMIRAIIEELK